MCHQAPCVDRVLNAVLKCKRSRGGGRKTYLWFRRSRRAGGDAPETSALKTNHPGKTGCLTCGGGGEVREGDGWTEPSSGHGWDQGQSHPPATVGTGDGWMEPSSSHGSFSGAGKTNARSWKATAASMGECCPSLQLPVPKLPWEKAPLPSPPPQGSGQSPRRDPARGQDPEVSCLPAGRSGGGCPGRAGLGESSEGGRRGERSITQRRQDGAGQRVFTRLQWD